jgi:hypothetical protein
LARSTATSFFVCVGGRGGGRERSEGARGCAGQGAHTAGARSRARAHGEAADQVLDVEEPARVKKPLVARLFQLELHVLEHVDLDVGLALAVAARKVLAIGEPPEPSLVRELEG